MTGSISLLFSILLQLLVIPYVFGLTRLNAMMKIKVGETFPLFEQFCIKYFLPVFMMVVFVIDWIEEFSYSESREEAGWTLEIYWGARMIMFVPMFFVPLVAFVSHFWKWKQKDVETFIEDQYGFIIDRDGAYDPTNQNDKKD